jgi:hypothetical protein
MTVTQSVTVSAITRCDVILCTPLRSKTRMEDEGVPRRPVQAPLGVMHSLFHSGGETSGEGHGEENDPIRLAILALWRFVLHCRVRLLSLLSVRCQRPQMISLHVPICLLTIRIGLPLTGKTTNET